VTPTDADLRGYLLGVLPDHASERIEQAYFARDEMFETVAAAERDLIDDYLAARLSPPERSRFETRYLASPRHRQRVAIARALRARRATLPRGRHWAPWALAAALAVGLVGVVWRLQAPAWGPAPIVAVTLPAVAVRGEGATPTAEVADDATLVELRLERGDAGPCAAPEIAVRTVEGAEVWRGPAVAEPVSGVPFAAVARVPAPRLPGGDYVALLTCGPGSETALQRSTFRVVRR